MILFSACFQIESVVYVGMNRDRVCVCVCVRVLLLSSPSHIFHSGVWELCWYRKWDDLKLMYLEFFNTVWDHSLYIVCLTLLFFNTLYHEMISPWQEYTRNLCNVTVQCPALLLNMIKLNQRVRSHASWKTSWYDTHFSLLEMHTDNSTNCTLLGPVDCDSFYKWIPLNRWPVAISSEVLHFIYCAFLSVSL